MKVPALPTQEQLRRALLPATQKLTKRNLRITWLQIEGRSTRGVATEYCLSHDRTYAIFRETVNELRHRLLTHAQRHSEFAVFTDTNLTHYRQTERRAWWLHVLQALHPWAPTEKDFVLRTMPVTTHPMPSQR